METENFKEELMQDSFEGEETEGSLTLEEFLAENPVSDETEEVVLSERLKSFTFKVGLMTKEQRNNYFNVCVVKDRKGKIIKQDMAKFNELIALNHCIYPNFQSMEFIKKCGCNTPADALYKVLKIGEIERLSQKIMEFNGFDDFEDLRKKAKN